LHLRITIDTVNISATQLTEDVFNVSVSIDSC